MLCIATPNLDSTPETYIQQHIHRIAPGNTVVLYFTGEGKGLRDIPSLKIIPKQNTGWMPRGFRSFANLVIYAYPGAISGRINHAAKEFLIRHEVRSVLAEFGPTGCALLPICNELGIRLIVNFHGHDATVMPKRWIIRHAYKRLNKYADAFACGSVHFAKVLNNLGFDQEKVHVLPCGIELDQFHPGTERDPDLIVAVGRFVEKKAPHLAIKAFIKTLKKFPDARLEMIGDGPLMDLCKKIISDEGIVTKVILHGAQSHEFVKQKLARASLFIQHSVVAANGDSESQGISLLEAMACEVPVVSTRHNGFVETVQEGVTGFLVDERDVSGMAECMIQVLSDRQLRDNMGKSGRKYVLENYEAGQMAKRMYDLLAFEDVEG